MADKALDNAMARRSLLQSKIAEKEQEILQMRAEIDKISAFIATWRLFADAEPGSLVELEHSVNDRLDTKRGTPRVRLKNPPKEEIGKIAEEIINDRGQPVPRNGIYAALQERGIHLRGSNPEMVLSTMLWRMTEKFVRLKGHGYWLKYRDYEPAGYKAPDIFQ